MELKRTQIDVVEMSAQGGVTLYAALQEAAGFCLHEDRVVRLFHNGRSFHLDPRQIIPLLYAYEIGPAGRQEDGKTKNPLDNSV